jgi:hypothetical protein
MKAVIKTHSGCTLVCLAAFLLLSQILFLWMYLSAESIEQAAKLGRFSCSNSYEFRQNADRFAAEWRHGMAGNSPLYLPGFFLTATFAWLWSLGRPLIRLLWEGLAILFVAFAVAALFAHAGASLAVHAFERYAGVRCQGPPPGFTLTGALAASFTVFTWCAGIISVQLSIIKRSLVPMIFPVILNVVLAIIRPWTVDDFTSQWVHEIKRLNWTALISSIVLLAVSTFLVLYLLWREGLLWKRASP